MEVWFAAAVALAFLGSVVLLRRVGATDGWGDRVRSRLLLGIPWGTLIAVALVLVVYLVVQSGLDDTRNPVVIPFQSWSYAYPLGWLTAGFAHSGYGHLVSNLTGMLVLGTVAEYAFSHFPQRRGAVSFGSRLANPYVRAFVVVPGALVLAGLFTSLFALGPVIGFSGVVFAVAGFALIRYPLGTVLALFAVTVVRRVFEAVRLPSLTRGFIETGPAPPWWAEVAIQGHAIGLLLGALAGIYVFHRRGSIPSPWRVWTGVLLFGFAQNLWAVYWFEGTDRWVLLQGIGVLAVVALAVLVTVAATSSDRPLVRGVSRRQAAVAVLAVSLALMMGPAVAVNLIATDPGEAADRPGLEVDDYRVIYAEEITNEMVVVGGLDLAGLDEVRTSGVIVYSEERTIWMRAVSAARLASDGQATIHLGDIATRTSVTAERPAWSVVGNASVFQVWLAADDDRVLAHESGVSTADLRVANHTFTLGSDGGTFEVTVAADGDPVDTVAIPEAGDAVDVGAVTLAHEDGSLYVLHDGTQVRIAGFNG